MSSPTLSAKQPRVPRELKANAEPSDRLFALSARGIGMLTLILTGAIAVFLGYQAIPTLHHYGLSFFTQQDWDPDTGQIGVASVLVGTVEVAVVAMSIAFPTALGMALFISDYAPAWSKPWFVSAIDLMAAVPSIIYGLWGFFLLRPHAANLARWLSQHFGWFPLFHVNTDANAAVWQQSDYSSSAFIAGIAVSMMAVPLACSVMRSVFDQAPIGEREAAMALGGTRWGVIKRVVLPFGKGAIVGGTMLGLGRALGETAAVLIILSPSYHITPRLLENGAVTTSYLIASDFGSSTTSEISALLTAGFVLFVITLGVNTVAAVVMGRNRRAHGEA